MASQNSDPPPLRDPPRLDAWGNPIPEDFFRPRPIVKPVPVDPVLHALERLKVYFFALYSDEAQDQLFGNGPVEKIYSVPRRFDTATLFAVSLAFAILFAILAYAGLGTSAKLSWCMFISVVGAAQAILFGSRAPRLASLVAGGLMLAPTVAPFTWADPGAFYSSIVAALLFGPGAGYLAGTLCGGVFLVADEIRTRYG